DGRPSLHWEGLQNPAYTSDPPEVWPNPKRGADLSSPLPVLLHPDCHREDGLIVPSICPTLFRDKEDGADEWQTRDCIA
ncbi:MAG: hypothetical protein KC978_17735, partial [Candidatus Omnitrophica bacterium]|nr:hypothetical protein [Candidatus Omnitrophota bacterium]